MVFRGFGRRKSEYTGISVAKSRSGIMEIPYMKGVAVSCAALLMGVATMTPDKVIELESRAFEEKNIDALFSQFYSPTLEVYLTDTPDSLIRAFHVFRNTELKEKREASIEEILNIESKKMFDNVEELRPHLEKQFIEYDDIKVNMIEQYVFGDYLLAYQIKSVAGKEIHALVLYEVSKQKIQRMWQVKIESGDF